MHHDSQPKIGVAFGSGSAKGVAHLGVLKVFEEHNFPIHYVAGSSIGAIVGAYYAMHPKYESVKNLVYTMSEKKLSSVLDITVRGGLIKGDKIENLLAEILPERFDKLTLPFAAVATDLTNAEVIVMQSGNLIKAVRASMSIPGFLRPVEIGTRILADGGLSNPVPVDVVRQMGADIVIGVNLDTLYVKNAVAAIPPLARIPSRSINILRHHLALKSTRSADVTIAPLVYSGVISWRDFFTKSKIDEFVTEGERAAREAIPLIKSVIDGYGRSSISKKSPWYLPIGLGQKILNRLKRMGIEDAN
jgi:NTE family protein